MKISDQIREAREKKGLTQKATAENLGVSASLINKIENEETLPSYERLKDLCVFFALPFDQLWKALEAERADALRSRIDARSALLPKANSNSNRQSALLQGEGVDSTNEGETVIVAEKISTDHVVNRELALAVGSVISHDEAELQEVRQSCDTLITALAAKPEMIQFVKEAVEGFTRLVRS